MHARRDVCPLEGMSMLFMTCSLVCKHCITVAQWRGALLCGTACKNHHAGFEAHGVSTRCVHVCVSCMDRTTILQYRNMTSVTGSLRVR